MKSALKVGLLSALLCSIPSAAWGKPEFARPPYGGFYEPQGKDERGLWMEMDEAERSLRDSPAVVRDAALNSWIQSVFCRTVGDNRCSGVRIYIVRDLSFNASMAPNGMMLVHTGLLLRLHSEAELAAVLGHEFGHFEKRHSLAALRARRGAANLIAWISLIGFATSTSTYDARQSIIFGYYRFERNEETEADLVSTVYVRSSPFKHRSSGIWFRMIEEDDHRQLGRGLKPGRTRYTGWLDSHPSELTRATYLSAVESESKEDGDDGKEAYAAATAGLMPELYAALVKSNDFGGADYILTSRGEDMGWDGPLLFARAELYRIRANPRDLITARDLYNTATKFADAPPEVWRGMGLCELRLGNIEAGKSALQVYLQKAPAAKDAESIKTLLEG